MIFWMRTNIRAVSSATVFYTLLVFLTQIADCKHIAFGRRIFDSCKTKSNYLVHFILVLKLIWNTTIFGTIENYLICNQIGIILYCLYTILRQRYFSVSLWQRILVDNTIDLHVCLGFVYFCVLHHNVLQYEFAWRFNLVLLICFKYILLKLFVLY